MDEPNASNSENASIEKMRSVAETIFIDFFDTLEKDETLSDVAPRLRKLVLEDRVFAEPAIRSALFPDAS